MKRAVIAPTLLILASCASSHDTQRNGGYAPITHEP